MKFRSLVTAALCLAAAAAQTAPKKDHSLGYDDTPYLPDGRWRVHDVTRPRPPMVAPGKEIGQPPSDAIVLFDGRNLSSWVANLKGKLSDPKWKVENGYVEVVPGSGGLETREKFGDIQLHIEWATPAEVHGASQARGNSGVLLMSRYEVQVLDSYDNPTYADGQAAAIYGQAPPPVNASRKPGEWQVYEIVFEAPHFEGEKLAKPAYVTVFHNGVLMHNRREILGRTPHAKLGTYEAHAAEEPLTLQNHGSPVRFRNIWIRKLKS